MSTTEWVIVVFVVLVVGFALGRRSTGVADAPRPMPRRIPGEGLDAATLTTVRAELRAGRKIDAIRIYRQATGLGLKDAKEAVEALAEREGIRA